MKAIKTIIMVVATCLMAGCYEDKGNYDYKDLPRITFEPESTSYDAFIGDLVEIDGGIVLSNGDSHAVLTYAWVLEGDTISTDEKLSWTADRETKDSYNSLILKVCEGSTGIVYQQAFHLDIVGIYRAGGFIVLAEREGKKLLHFLKEKEVDDELTYEINDDLYGQANGGTALPADAFMLVQHYCSVDREGNNQYIVAGRDGITEIETAQYTKVDYTLSDAFAGNVPGGLRIDDMYYMQFVDMIRDENGQLYMRVKETSEFFNYENFSAQPVEFGEPGYREVLTNVDIIPSHFAEGTEYTLLQDNAKQRFLLVWDFIESFSHDFSAGKIIELTSDMHSQKWLPDTVEVAGKEYYTPKIEKVLTDYDVIHVGAYKEGYFGGQTERYALFLRHKETKALFLYEFGLEKEYSSANISFLTKTVGEKDKQETVVDTEFRPLTSSTVDRLLNDPQTKILTQPLTSLSGATQYITLLANGSELWAYNRKATDEKAALEKLDLSFQGTITQLHMSYANGANRLGVACDNGNFYVLQAGGMKLDGYEAEAVIWKDETGSLGKIIDMEYNVQAISNNWN